MADAVYIEKARVDLAKAKELLGNLAAHMLPVHLGQLRNLIASFFEVAYNYGFPHHEDSQAPNAGHFEIQFGRILNLLENANATQINKASQFLFALYETFATFNQLAIDRTDSQNQNVAVRGENAGLRALNVGLRDENVSLLAEHVSLRAENVSLLAENAGLRDEKISLRDQNVAVRGENAGLRAEHVSLRAENVSLLAENAGLRDEKISLRDQNVAVRGENAGLRDENVSLRAESDVLRAKIETLQSMI